MGIRVGIDLGTTFSLVARMDGGVPCVVPNALGERLTPSVVGLSDDGEVLVGAVAAARAVTHPQSTFRCFKRDMGTDRTFTTRGRTFRPEELSAMVLRQLKADTEAALGDTVIEAVVTVPAYFGELQRRATRDACEIAELHVERLINEPTAAALAYGLQQRDREARIVVLDLGGGTFDVSVLEITGGVIEIQASAGDARLGGEDFTQALIDLLAEKARVRFGVDPRTAPLTLAPFLEACERAKQALSTETSAAVRLPSASAGYRETPRELELTREEAERRWEPVLKQMYAPIRRALRDARVVPTDVDEVILVGGATRTPCVRAMVERMFGRMPLHRVSADEAVALGAAVQVALKSGDAALGDLVATDVAPFSLGVAVIETHGRHRLDDVFSPILERGTVLPASRVERFVTAADQQTAIRVVVYQGEHSLCRDNTKLGEYQLAGLPTASAGEEAIDVRFTYDLNGILEVDMTIVSTGASKSLVLERSPGRMTPAEVQRARVAMATLKFHPRDALPNTTALARADALFAELIGSDRDRLGHAMRNLRLALEAQAPQDIEDTRRALLLLVDRLRR